MRDLIAQRPNLIPTGIGNSASGFDTSIIFNDSEDEIKDTNPSVAKSDSSTTVDWLAIDAEIEASDDEVEEISDLKDENEDNKVGLKRKSQTDVDKSKGKTQARPGISAPATPSTTQPKKKTKLEEFAEVAKAEEITRQRELELATLQSQENLARTKAKARLSEKKLEARREERLFKLKLQEMKMTQQYELRMAAMRNTHHGTPTHSQGLMSTVINPSFPPSRHQEFEQGSSSSAPPSSGLFMDELNSDHLGPYSFDTPPFDST